MNRDELVRRIESGEFALESIRFWDWAADCARSGYCGRVMSRCCLCGHDRIIHTFLWMPDNRQLDFWTEGCYVCRFSRHSVSAGADPKTALSLKSSLSALSGGVLSGDEMRSRDEMPSSWCMEADSWNVLRPEWLPGMNDLGREECCEQHVCSDDCR